ncbi:MAG: hypothetical protein ACHRHE_11340 [Tepidisphaerales bacterium]
MLDAKQTLDRYFLEMRWRCLSLAADLDRVQRGQGSEIVLSDPRLGKVRQAVQVLLEPTSGRAERVLMVFSDLTPPPK